MSSERTRRLLIGQVGLVSAVVVATVALTAAPASSQEPPTTGIGRPATQAEIAAWDADSAADGAGLPLGRGTARAGAAIFEQKCSACHGASGREGPFDRLVGPEPWRVGVDRTVGNYWPYATTLVDYIYRAMPFNAPGSLTPDEAYAVAAWILYQNDVIAEDAVLDRQTAARIQMPGRSIFVPDARPDAQE